MNPALARARGVKLSVVTPPLTYNDLQPGDMLYVEYSNEYHIFVEHTLDYLIFIAVHATGHFAKRRMPRESVAEGDFTLQDAGWEVYRP